MQLSSETDSVAEAPERPAEDRTAPRVEPPAGGAGALARRTEHPVPAQAKAPEGAAGEGEAQKPRRKGRRRTVLLAILAIALAGGTYEGYHWWTVGRFELSTDNAYLGADMSVLSAKVSGYVTAVAVAENQPVKKGDVIVRIDDGDYRLAVRSANDKIIVQQAVVERIGVQIEAARAGIEEADANVDSAQASLTLAAGILDRKMKLSKTDFASRESVDTARADRDKAAAALAAAKAERTSAEANVSVLEAERAEAAATLESLRTALKQAERDLAFAVVTAPVDGVIGNKAVEVGELVEPGKRLAAVVPLASVYVEANFKETQLEDMHAGQTAEITVDAFPGKVFSGEVASISPASGALFSLLPPENATGNFTKIVQRLPVRIALSQAAIDANALRPGMSAVVTVDTRTGGEGTALAGVVGTAAAREAPAAPEAAPVVSAPSTAAPDAAAPAAAPAKASAEVAATRQAPADAVARVADKAPTLEEAVLPTAKPALTDDHAALATSAADPTDATAEQPNAVAARRASRGL